MGLLQKLGEDHATRQRVLDDLVTLVEAEVAAKGGLTGIAIKGGYAVFKRFRPGMLRRALDHFFDPFLAALEPLYADFERSGGNDVVAYFRVRAADVTETLLRITDAKAATADSSLKPLKIAYDRLRPIAAKHVEAAVPQFVAVCARHLPAR